MVSLGFFIIDNGKNILQTKNVIDLQYRKKAHTYILLNDLSLMTVDKDNLVNSGFQHLRYNYTIKDSSFLTFEAFGQHQYNTIKLLERRFLLGGGPRFRLINSKTLSFYIGALGMYEYEQQSDSLRTKFEFARLSSYGSFSWDILENLSLNNITYYQPVFTEFERYRVSTETSIGLKITNALSFKIALQTIYDSHPPEGIQELFYNWSNSLKYVF
jgi:putative salt-induced outer membrane protein YdiY